VNPVQSSAIDLVELAMRKLDVQTRAQLIEKLRAFPSIDGGRLSAACDLPHNVRDFAPVVRVSAVDITQ